MKKGIIRKQRAISVHCLSYLTSLYVVPLQKLAFGLSESVFILCCHYCFLFYGMFLGCCRDPDSATDSCIPWLRQKKTGKSKKDIKNRRKSQYINAHAPPPKAKAERKTSRDYPSSAEDHDQNDPLEPQRRVSRYSAVVAPKLKDLSLNMVEATLEESHLTVQNGLQTQLHHIPGFQKVSEKFGGEANGDGAGHEDPGTPVTPVTPESTRRRSGASSGGHGRRSTVAPPSQRHSRTHQYH